jgi:hypothetical protein
MSRQPTSAVHNNETVVFSTIPREPGRQDRVLSKFAVILAAPGVVACVFYASLMLKIFKVIRFGMRDQDAREVIAATLGLLAFGTVW